MGLFGWFEGHSESSHEKFSTFHTLPSASLTLYRKKRAALRSSSDKGEGMKKLKFKI